MIRHAGLAKLVALSVALVLHGAFVVALVSRESIEIEGADGAAEVRLGNAFADMSAGTLSAEHPEKAEVATSPETTDSLDVDPAETTPPENAQETVQPEQSESAQPAQVERLSSEPTAATVDSETPEQVTTAQAVPVARAEASAPDQAAASAPSEAEALKPASVSDRVEGEAPKSAAVTRSLRPKRRSTEFEATHKPVREAKPKPQPKTKPAEKAKSAPGNAKRNARAGDAKGKRDAEARQSGTRGRKQAVGNAAASNYPGLVMRRLSRAGKPRVNARGASVVAFRISANGALGSVSLARSSGSSALDRAALRLVRRAAPFPKPPQGARRSFSIQIKGR
ncbi:TonB family protein [Roseovarius sp. MMSF_3281]|uniref:cell envelope integrity protein TolA n=1 Tax=Roseovarius sp. MMSF_3281 TaxID=3046694 RepID=UPI00273EB8B0|nr:TonB family protein [Roseovarius sp. MMSF_3281]